MKTCCIDGCEISSKKDVTLFEFPTSRLLRKRWVDAINPSSKLAVDAVICSQHFAAEDYEDFRGKVRLKSKVIPTLFGDEVSKPPEDPLGIPVTEVSQESKEPNKNDKRNGNVDNNNEHVDNNENETETAKKDTTENGHSIDNNSENVDRNNENVDRNNENVDKNSENIEKNNEKVASNNENGDKLNENVDSNNGNVVKDNENVDTTNVINKTKRVKKKWVPMRKIARRNGHLDSESSQDSDNSDLPDPPILEDLEEHLPNYQIANMKTERQIAAMTETIDPVEDIPMEEDVEEIVMEPHIPVFIELSVGQDAAVNAEEQPNDCLMVLESVQCDVDPTLMLEARAEDEECCEQIDLDDDDDDDVQHVDIPAAVDPVKTPKKSKPPPDPISLLTSSDEDDVILQEPHIDTLSVSDETDEDDLPLQKLIKKTKKASKKTKKKKKTKPEPIKSILCGVTDYFCTHCQYTSPDYSSHKKHLRTHKEAETPTGTTKVYQICKECGFTTSSKSQLHRHQRKHLHEKKYKCPVCSYRSKYNMSLMYHLKTHDFDPNMYNCGSCGVELDSKRALLEHQKTCSAMDEKYVCSVCGYVAKDKRVMKIHKNSAHKQKK